MLSENAFNSDKGKILSLGKGLKDIGWGSIGRIELQSCADCRARSACTYVQSALARHSPQNKTMIADGRIRTHQILDCLILL